MEIRYRLINTDGSTLFSSLTEEDLLLISQVKTPSQKYLIGKYSCRAGTMKNANGEIYAFTNDSDLVESSKKFIVALSIVGDTLKTIREICAESTQKVNANTKRLIHNLTSLNAHNIQEIYNLVPQDKISQSFKGQLALVENIIRESPREVAFAILRVAKNNVAMKTEFSVFTKLFDPNPQLRITSHNVHRVLMNIFYIFFSDFTDKDVKVNLGDSNVVCNFDYESVHVALYHLIENATKYIKPSSELNVSITNLNGDVRVIFEMMSLEIRPDEKEKIFEEGYSGVLTEKTAKSGSGLGLHLVKRIMELNSGLIEVNIDRSLNEVVMGLPYQINRFILNFKESKSKRATRGQVLDREQHQ